MNPTVSNKKGHESNCLEFNGPESNSLEFDGPESNCPKSNGPESNCPENTAQGLHPQFPFPMFPLLLGPAPLKYTRWHTKHGAPFPRGSSQRTAANGLAAGAANWGGGGETGAWLKGEGSGVLLRTALRTGASAVGVPPPLASPFSANSCAPTPAPRNSFITRRYKCVRSNTTLVYCDAVRTLLPCVTLRSVQYYVATLRYSAHTAILRYFAHLC